MPAGYDNVRLNAPHGKVDTITYHSNTVGEGLEKQPVSIQSTII
jgi:hypothetical protein